MRSLKFRYSLRTFLVVIAIVACWLGYHLRIKNQRAEKLAWLKARGSGILEYELNKPIPPGWDLSAYQKKEAQISNIRLCLGDNAVCAIALRNVDVTDEDRVVKELEALFPETWVLPELKMYSYGGHDNKEKIRDAH